jgi:triosephosphate isomerase (TIM)
MEIIINFKNYKAGKDALKLARKIKRYLPKAIVAVPAVDISAVRYYTKLRVMSQHVSGEEKGKTSGYLIPESLKAYDVSGTLLNHSEHRISGKEISDTIKRCKKVGLKVLLCVQDLREAKKYKKLKPYSIALEDRKLIGTGRSITDYRQDEVVKFVKLLKGSGIMAICGAGVSTKEDVIAAKKLGCKGVLIASAIADASDKKVKKLLKEIDELN